MSDEETDQLKLALVRRNPFHVKVWFLVFATCVAVFFFGLHYRYFWLVIIGFIIFAFLLPMSIDFWFRNPFPHEAEGIVHVDEKGVWLHNSLVLPIGRIKSGFVVPRSNNRPIVVFQRQWYLPALEIRVEDEDSGRALLKILNLDASQTVASFILPSRLRVNKPILTCFFVMLAAFYFGVIGGRHIGTTIPRWSIHLSMAWFFGFVLLLQLTRVRLCIGADGLTLKSWRKERLLKYDDIKTMEIFNGDRWWQTRCMGVQIALESGETILLPVAAADASGVPRAGLILNRLQEAFADHKRGKPASPEARLSRGDRPMQAWVRELRRTGAGAAANHRIAPLPNERLLEVAEDPQADPITRANAAIALGANTETEEFRTRLRVAAQATAAPRLRVALERAANVDDEAALAEALAEVEAEARQNRTEQ